MSNLPSAPQERKGIPIGTGVLDYFPDALAEVAKVSLAGNKQHGIQGDKLMWDRSKSTDESDALIRHYVDRYKTDSDGLLHAAKMAWRGLAFLQKLCEANSRKDLDDQHKEAESESEPNTLEFSPGGIIQCDSITDGQQIIEEARDKLTFINERIKEGYSAELAYVASSDSTYVQLYKTEGRGTGVSRSFLVRGKVQRKKDRERGDIQPRPDDSSKSQLTLWNSPVSIQP